MLVSVYISFEHAAAQCASSNYGGQLDPSDRKTRYTFDSDLVLGHSHRFYHKVKSLLAEQSPANSISKLKRESHFVISFANKR